MEKKLEVIAFNISCCKEIESAGAHRIELCANPSEGGTTPSAGFIQAARDSVGIELFPIIRPRGGDFFYNQQEFEIMKADVLFCKQVGCDGVVTGMLLKDGTIDREKISEIVNLAKPMQVTFHRAFDRTADPFSALEDVIDAGCTRILTSGLRPIAAEGVDLIAELIKRANGRIIIMPGSGIRSSNLKQIAEKTGALEFHSSARKLVPGKMRFVNPNMTEDQKQVVVDKDEVLAMVKALHSITNV